ncbi:MAG: hypothetical protein ACP5OA_04035 [Candidatus Woesearchaeota archaeon]
MGFQDRTLHLILETLVLIIVPYIFLLSFTIKQKFIHKIILFCIALGNLIIDVYAILNWFIKPLLPRQAFHQFTEALAIPAGLYTIWLGFKQDKWYNKTFLIIFGTLGIIIDGYLLFFTW